MHSNVADLIMNSVGLQFASLTMKISSKIRAWSEKEVSVLCLYARENLR